MCTYILAMFDEGYFCFSLFIQVAIIRFCFCSFQINTQYMNNSEENSDNNEFIIAVLCMRRLSSVIGRHYNTHYNVMRLRTFSSFFWNMLVRNKYFIPTIELVRELADSWVQYSTSNTPRWISHGIYESNVNTFKVSLERLFHASPVCKSMPANKPRDLIPQTWKLNQ